MEYKFDCELIENERVEEQSTNLACRNHNSANSRPKDLEPKINRKVLYGFALPVWVSAVTKIPKQWSKLVGWSHSERCQRQEREKRNHA